MLHSLQCRLHKDTTWFQLHWTIVLPYNLLLYSGVKAVNMTLAKYISNGIIAVAAILALLQIIIWMPDSWITFPCALGIIIIGMIAILVYITN